MLLLHCAHRHEALPVIARFGLQKYQRKSPFPVFLDKDRHTALTISGRGKVAAAAACMNLVHILDARAQDAWLNVGIAGHGHRATGTPIIVHKVIDAATDKTWFPHPSWPTSVDSDTCLTVDVPRDSYENRLHDMEASGFMEAVSRLTSLELAHSLKVVSDNDDNPHDRVTPGLARELVESALPVLLDIAGHLRAGAEVLDNSQPGVDLVKSFLKHWHFTETQQHQLANKLRRWQCLFPNLDPLQQFSSCKDARSVLQGMHTLLEQAPMTVGQKGA